MKGEVLLFFLGDRQDRYIVHRLPFMGNVRGARIKGQRPIRAIMVQYEPNNDKDFLERRNEYLNCDLLLSLEDPIPANVLLLEVRL